MGAEGAKMTLGGDEEGGEGGAGKGLDLESVDVTLEHSQFDLTLVLSNGAGIGSGGSDTLCGALQYNTALFDQSTIQRMARHFQTLLESAVAAPATKLSDLRLMSKVEIDMITVDWNQTDFAFRRDVCVHQWVEEQVERTPDALAVVSLRRRRRRRRIHQYNIQC